MIDKLTREQAFAFIGSLWPSGHMAHLDNPTRTYFSALLGHVPSGEAYSDSDPNQAKLRAMADYLRQIAGHIEISGNEATNADR